MDIKIFQIYYDDAQLGFLEKSFIPFFHPSPIGKKWFEYHVFLTEYAKMVQSDSHVGYVSWKFGYKTQVRGDKFSKFIQDNPGYDVYGINPFYIESLIFRSQWEGGEYHHPGILELTRRIFSELGYKIDALGEIQPYNLQLYANYWVGNFSFWKKYMEYSLPIYDFIENCKDEKLNQMIMQRADSKIVAPFIPFIMERLFTTLLLKDSSIKYLPYKYDNEDFQKKYRVLRVFFPILETIRSKNKNSEDEIKYLIEFRDFFQSLNIRTGVIKEFIVKKEYLKAFLGMWHGRFVESSHSMYVKAMSLALEKKRGLSGDFKRWRIYWALKVLFDFRKLSYFFRNLLFQLPLFVIKKICVYQYFSLGSILFPKMLAGIKRNIEVRKFVSEKSVCIFASFSVDSKIGEYVFYYLEKLQSLGFQNIFVVTSDHLTEDDEKRLHQLCYKIIHRRNNGYDFGSWRTGIDCEKNLSKAKGLLLCNDSVFGPFADLQKIFQKMENEKFDLWGLTDTTELGYHIQSYFLYFSESFLQSNRFKKFWKSVKYFPSSMKSRIIFKNEIGLTKFMQTHNQKVGVLIGFEEVFQKAKECFDFPRGLYSKEEKATNYPNRYWDVLINEFGFPFIKKDLLEKNPLGVSLKGWREILIRQGYDPSLITKQIQVQED